MKSIAYYKKELEKWTTAFRGLSIQQVLDRLNNTSRVVLPERTERERERERETNSEINKDKQITELNQEINRLKSTIQFQKTLLAKEDSEIPIMETPIMKDAFTQTEELTMDDLATMEENIKKLNDFVNNNFFLNDEQKHKDIDFNLQIIERGIDNLREDKKHIAENGQQLKVGIERLQREVKEKSMTEAELENKIDELELLLRKKESEFQQKIKTKQEDWDKLNADYEELVKTFSDNNNSLKQKGEAMEQLKKQMKELGEDKDKEKKELEEKIQDLEREMTLDTLVFANLREEIRVLENSVVDKENLYQNMIQDKVRYEAEQKEAVALKIELQEDMKDIFSKQLNEKWKDDDWKYNINKLVEKLRERNQVISEKDKLLSQLSIYRKNTIFELNASNFEANKNTYLDMMNQGLHTEDCLVLTSNYEPQSTAPKKYTVDLTSFSYNRPFVWVHSLLGEWERNAVWDIILIKYEQAIQYPDQARPGWGNSFFRKQNGGYISDASISSNAKNGRCFDSLIARSSGGKKIYIRKQPEEARSNITIPNKTSDYLKYRGMKLSFYVSA